MPTVWYYKHPSPSVIGCVVHLAIVKAAALSGALPTFLYFTLSEAPILT